MAEFITTTLMDSYAGGPHITETQIGLANQATFGPDDYVLGGGRESEAQVLTNNSIRIFDAVYCIQGRRDVIPASGYTDVTIANGTQGMNRNDIIVRRYRKDESSEIESTEYAVIKGTPNAGEALDPEVTIGDIRTGATLHEMKLYRVKIEGLNITAVEPLFNILKNMAVLQQEIAKTNKDLSNQLAEIRKKMTGKYAYAYSAHLDNEKSTKTSLTLNRIKATGHGRKCILMCWGAMKVTTLTARLSVYVNGKESCSGITSSTSYVPVFDSNIITLPEGENTIEIRLSAQANTATAYIGRYHKLGFIVAEL